MGPGSPTEFWRRVDKALSYYENELSPTAWCGVFINRAGIWVVLRGLILLVALKAVFCIEAWAWKPFLALLAVALLLDILLVHTSQAARLTRKPKHFLRSLILSLSSYFEIAVVFAVLYGLVAYQFNPPLGARRALYFSFVTIATLGYGDIVPHSDGWTAQLFVIAEIAIGLYFVAIVIARFVAWGSSKRTPRRWRR